MLILHAILLAVLTTLARLAMLSDATNSSNDNVGSVRVTAAQRKQRWLGFTTENSIIQGTYGYPPLVYWIVSHFDRKRWAQLRYWLNYLADTATTLLVWGAILWLAPDLPREVALLVALAFGLNTLLLPGVEHARVSAPNARAMGLLFNTLWIAGLTTLVARPDLAVPVALAMVPLSWLTVLTSQFGMQSMVGLSVCTALVAWSPWPVVALMAGVGSGYAVKGLGVRETLQHKFVHWRWYSVVQRTVANAASYRARPWRVRTAAMLTLFASPFRNGWTLGTELQRSAWWKMLAGVAPFLAFVGMTISAGSVDSALAAPLTRALAIVCASAGVLFFLTTQPRLVFLGEAERYIEHALGGIAVLSVLFAAGQPERALAAAVLGVVVAVTLLVAQLAHRQWTTAQIMMQYPALGFGGEREMLKRFVSLGVPVRIATVPVKAAFLLHDLLLDEAMPGSERVSFYFQHVVQPGDDRFRYMMDDTVDGNEYLRDDLPALVQKYGIDLIVVDSAWLYDHTNTAPILETLRLRQVQYTSGRFAVLSLQDLKPNTAATGAGSTVDLLFPKPKSAREIARERAMAAAAASA
ncbi:hypothetical protein [Gemmatimonas phototrophica]|uniref:Glycosyltransferase RgtA/B/C/D-like domain-containing protein n=1 Tax=Gemmatimonas phototrophica TaxID=1379270 RepID=A0A143BHL2_9BACT|nr:hypothetical protein [Gemmatimonas phototrophica]AMW04002.1 hypothetical protein GEMMAAP_02440 [Gemmatimonas phototrophica]